MRFIKKASTSQSIVIRIIDSTTGLPENAVEHDTAGIDLWYRREAATKTSITEVALAALDSAYSAGGIELIGDGYYRFDIPDAAFAIGANGVMIGGTVTGMIVIGDYIPLVDYDPQDTIRLGLTALPNAVVDAAGGLPISDAGGLDLDGVLSGNTPQTVDNNTILAHVDYGNAKLVRSTTPANSLDVSATGEAGLDFDNIKDATGAHTLTNITVPVTTTVTNEVSADTVKISGDSAAADNVEATYDGTGYTENSAPATQEQVGRLTSGTAAINTVAGSFTPSGAEPETNTYTSTFALDGVFHIVEDVANATDAYYEFDVGGNGVPVSVTWQGYAQGIGDSYTIWAYNYGTTTYEQVGTITAGVGTTVVDETFSLTNAHVGTGANAGKVRFRFLSADGSAFATDRLLCSYAVVSESAGYSDGAIWINTLNSNTNTTDYVDGTSDNPVSTWAAAKTLSVSLSIKKFHIVNGSTITLDANSDNFTFVGHEWILALGGQSIANAHFEDATVSGTSAGTGAHFKDCTIGTCSLTQCDFTRCHFPGEVVTLLSAAIYTMHDCGTGGAAAPPTFDFGAALGNSQIVLNNWSGGVKIVNLNAAGVDKVSVIGNGKLTIDSTCAGGTIGIHGLVTITDNVVGGFVVGGGTINDDARYDIYQINDEVAAALVTYDPPTDTQMLAAFTEIKGATWAAGTDTLEHIRNKQTDIETDIADIPTVAEFDARTLLSADYVVVGDTIAGVTLCGTLTTYTGNTLQTGDSFTRIGAAGASLTDLGGMSVGMLAEVESECTDAINNLTLSEMAQGAPAATPSLPLAINYLYRMWRNKTETTATLITLYDDIGTTELAKSTISDDTVTFAKAEFVTGT